MAAMTMADRARGENVLAMHRYPWISSRAGDVILLSRAYLSW